MSLTATALVLFFSAAPCCPLWHHYNPAAGTVSYSGSGIVLSCGSGWSRLIQLVYGPFVGVLGPRSNWGFFVCNVGISEVVH